MTLIEYRLKRDFKKTREPEPQVEKVSQQRFVVQQHQASHLHYDFRLELVDEQTKQVVLKSWAVPKNIPLSSGIKHLAIQTEDHPVAYLKFEGDIPLGNYGAGTVKIWDQGKYGLLTGNLQHGMLKFNLLGKRLNGRYAMIRTKKIANSKKNDDYWLIWKMDDYL